MLAMNNFLPVLVAAAVHLGVGCLWYSDHLFGKMWKKLGGKCSMKNLHMKFALHVLAAVLTASALMLVINVFQQAQAIETEGVAQLFGWFLDSADQGLSMMNAVKVAGFLWAGVSMPAIAVSAVWGDHHSHRFLIDAAGELVALSCMGVALSYLA